VWAATLVLGNRGLCKESRFNNFSTFHPCRVYIRLTETKLNSLLVGVVAAHIYKETSTHLDLTNIYGVWTNVPSMISSW
jgi:hypothetical protein